jgi:hypothetical protein
MNLILVKMPWAETLLAVSLTFNKGISQHMISIDHYVTADEYYRGLLKSNPEKTFKEWRLQMRLEPNIARIIGKSLKAVFCESCKTVTFSRHLVISFLSAAHSLSAAMIPFLFNICS